MGAVWGGACAGSASSDAAPSRGYRRREPERTLLHATVRAHWKTFLAEMEERGRRAYSEHGISARRGSPRLPTRSYPSRCLTASCAASLVATTTGSLRLPSPSLPE